MGAALEEIEKARCLFEEKKDLVSGDDLKTMFLGRNGIITSLMKVIGKVPKEDKAIFGKTANILKKDVESFLSKLKSGDNSVNTSWIDVTLPGKLFPSGTLHPITELLNDICDLFQHLGFSIVDGPEIENTDNNFTNLNIAKDHPSRDMHDTFYFDVDRLLRTHTSPVQIRTMKGNRPPYRIIAPGKVYRCDSDVTHSPMFHQIEGLYVAKGVNFGHLKSNLNLFLKAVFGPDVKLRFRPSFFPFTEPSVEVDISCVFCSGKGCRTCSKTGWLEILGAGMVDPNVLENVGVNPQEFSGYAFGLGVERIAMLKFGINDIRLFYENHLGFLEQFN